ncbi:Piwi domain-containing protein [Haloplanus vescus]|uniref:Piwi domain-containing protein n=1 Tax=Haloplanus vescus TaxID=555874 RepID=A0A1H3X247_9EURY|nr:Piwi domain-containing protein [Haloplanus vescus]SDZ92608.1 Piwi domain-containing protein [Haloplanus vescus]
MALFANSFEIEVPKLSAAKYSIDPQPSSSDPWKQLDNYERAIKSECSGSAQRINEDGKWYILSIGSHDSKPSVTTNDGTELTKIGDTTVGGESGKYQEAVIQSLRDSLGWFVTTQLDYWELGNSQRFYEWNPSDIVDGYDTYHGYSTSIEFNDGYYLTIDPTVKFISDLSVYDYLKKFGSKKVENLLLDRNCTLMSNDRHTVELVSIADDLSVSDKTMTLDGEDTSVYEYIQNNDNYSDEQAERVDPSEPLARIQFYWSDEPVDSAPSLLHPHPEEIEPSMTGYASRSSRSRWGDTERFAQDINYIQVFNTKCPVSDSPRQDGSFSLNYPPLQFGGGNEMVPGQNNAIEPDQIIHERNWRYVLRDYLEEFGPVSKHRGAAQIDLLHPDGREDTALEMFDKLQSYANEYVGITIQDRPGTVSHQDYQELREWIRRHRSNSDGVIVLLDSHSEEYHDILAELDGLPAQAIQLKTYRESFGSDGFSNSLYNVVCGLATKIGTRPFLLSSPLEADLYLGMSVTGDEVNSAAAVLISGSNGDLIHQTTNNLATGSSTVTNFEVSRRIVRQLIAEAIDRGLIEDPQSLIIHRNGQFGDAEIDGIRDGISELQDSGHINGSFDWQAIEISESSGHRLYSDTGNRTCETGAAMRLDSQNVIVSTYGKPEIHQGSPSPLHCSVSVDNGDISVEGIASDVFKLSFLNWGSPMMKMKHPLTTQLPSQMHDILSSGIPLSYPPF